MSALIIIICVVCIIFAAAIGVTALVILTKEDMPVVNRFERPFRNPLTEQKTAGMAFPVKNGTIGIETMTVTLTALTTGSSVKTDITDFITVGRNQSNRIVISEPTVSGIHAKIIKNGEMLCIEDLSSKNGTLLNGGLISQTEPLNRGDVLTFGTEEYEIQF